MVPTFFSAITQRQENRIYDPGFQSESVNKISQAVAVILFLLYMLTVVYQLRAREGEELTQKPSAIRDPETTRMESPRRYRGTDGGNPGHRSAWGNH